MKEVVIKALVAFAALLAPIHTTMFAVGFIVVADFVSGMIAAKKRGEEIKSSRMRDTVTKLGLYQAFIISAFLLETFLLSDAVPVVKILAAIIGMTEFKSLTENMSAILGRDLFKELIDKLGSKNK